MRYPAGGLSREQITEIRRIKARVENERLPRGADPATHTKLGRGGLADVEWAVQLLQLRHGHAVPGLRSTRTLDALAAAARGRAGVAGGRRGAGRRLGARPPRVRNALTLVRGRPGDQLPRHGAELAGVVRLLGAADPGEFLDDYLRTARRCRAAVERVLDRCGLTAAVAGGAARGRAWCSAVAFLLAPPHGHRPVGAGGAGRLLRRRTAGRRSTSAGTAGCPRTDTASSRRR